MEGSRAAVADRGRRIYGIAPAMLGMIVLASGPSPAGGQSAAPADAWVEAVFPDRSHDFGTVARGSILRHSFRITNRTNRDVHIVSWKPKCGCTDVTVGAETIPPGAQTTVETVFDTTRYPGGYKASGLTLTIDQPASRTIDYELSCFIQDEVVVDPGVIDFGEVKRGEKAEKVVSLQYLGGQRAWAVLEMKHTNKALAAELQELPASDTGAIRYRLVARLDPEGLRNGNFRDEITVVTNDPQRRKIPVSVAAKVVSDISLAPAVLNLGTVKAGKRVERTVLLKGTSPFRVTGMEAVQGTIEPVGEAPEESKPLHQLRVAIEAPAAAGAYHAILEIRTDRPDEPPARLTAFATVVP